MTIRIGVFEKNALNLTFLLAATGSLPVLYFFGAPAFSGFLLGAALAAVSFAGIIGISNIVIPVKDTHKIGLSEKMTVAFIYLFKISLFIFSFWFISKNGMMSVILFTAGFTTLVPSLFIAALKKPPQK